MSYSLPKRIDSMKSDIREASLRLRPPAIFAASGEVEERASTKRGEGGAATVLPSNRSGFITMFVQVP